MTDIDKVYFEVREAFYKLSNETLNAMLADGHDRMVAKVSDVGDVFLEYVAIVAVNNRRYDVLELVHAHKLDLNPDPLVPNQYHTMIQACRLNDVKLIAWLIDHGIDCRRRYSEGITALHQAAFNDSYEAIDLLLSSGADIEAVDDEGVTPLSVAVKWGNATTVEHLLSLGANPNTVDKQGRYPLDQAIKDLRFDRLEILLEAGAKTSLSLEAIVSEDVRNIVYPYLTNRRLKEGADSVTLNSSSRSRIAL